MLGVALVILGALAFANRSAIRSGIDQLVGNDYQGGGYSSILFEIEPGDTGESIANSLVEQGVVKNFRTVYKLILDENPQFYPGTYQLRLRISVFIGAAGSRASTAWKRSRAPLPSAAVRRPSLSARSPSASSCSICGSSQNQSASGLRTSTSSRFAGADGGSWTFLAETDVRQRATAQRLAR